MLTGKYDVRRLVEDIKKGEETITKVKYEKDSNGTPHWKYEGLKRYLTERYAIRAALRGRLHMARVGWGFNKTEKIQTKKGARYLWTLEEQESYIRDEAMAYLVEDNPAPIA